MKDILTSSTSTRKTSSLLLGVFLFLMLAGAIFAAANEPAMAVDNAAASDLAVNKSVDVDQPMPDQIVTFTVHIFNSGVISATNGTVTDNLDGNLTFVGPVNIEGGGDAATTGDPPTIATSLTISPSMGVTITFPVRVNSDIVAGTEIGNTAVAESSEYGPANSNEVVLTVTAPTEVRWKQRSTGIDGGRVNVLLVDPQHTAKLYAGTPVGLFKSVDGGDNWITSNSPLDNIPIYSLAQDPLDGNLLYAGTAQGVFKSRDGGSSWITANNGLAANSISSLAIDPGQPATLYAGTEAGVFKSSDWGGSWAAASAGLSEPQITALVIDPHRSNTLYAGTASGGVFKSSDGGGSWAPANSGLYNLHINMLAIDPLSETFYAGTDEGLFKSENDGRNWSSAGSDLASLAVLALAIDPADGETLYAGTESGIAKSSNGGRKWSPIHAGETPTLAIDPLNNASLFAGSADEGVLKSDDYGDSWNPSARGLDGGNISALTMRRFDSNQIFAGTKGAGLFKSKNGGQTWLETNNGLANLDVNTLAVPSGNNTEIYAGTDGGVFKSDDDGDNWTSASAGLANSEVRTLVIHPTRNRFLYAGTAGGGLFRSSNSGGSWSAANNGLTDPQINALAIDPNDGEILYAGTQGGGVFKSIDGGSSWTAANSGLTMSTIRTLAIDPTNSQVVCAGGPDGLFNSSNGGGSWAASSDGLDDAAVQALAFDPANSSILYAATAEDGVWRSTGSGFNWTAINDGLTVPQVRALALASSNTLYAGTMGGVFSSGPHLDVTKQVDNPHPDQGKPLNYTILIENGGTLPVSAGTVTDSLNGNLKFVGPVTLQGGGAAAKTGSPPLIVKKLALEAGETATVTLPVQVNGGLDNGTVIPNMVVVDAPQLHNPASDEISVTAYRPNKLETKQSVDNHHPQAGETVHFSIEIKNTGNQGVGGIDVMNILDPNLTFVGPVQISGGSGTPGTPPLIASGLGVDAGRTVSVKVPFRVNERVLPGTAIGNVAQVTSYRWPVPISSQASIWVADPPARHFYVDANAAVGLNNGSNWGNAHTSLQAALLNAGSGSEIWVADGVYYPDVGDGLADDDPEAAFQLRSGVAIYGGFDGTESSLDERDPAANITILSGDIDGNDTGSCENYMLKGSNSMHVVSGSAVTSGALLDGFTISGGDARGMDGSQHGGGMINEQGSPTLSNLIFCGNQATGSGGGIFNENSSPTLHDVQFVNNRANVANGRGGGMANVNNSQPTLENVEFNGNEAYYGGGLFNSGSKPTISDGIFNENRAAWGGGIFNTSGSDGTISNSSVTDNEAAGGGGMGNDNSSPKLINVTLASNKASQKGGGLSTSGGSPVLANPVFSGNLAEAQANGQQSWGGGLYVAGGQPTLANATVSGNWAAARGTRATDEGLGGGLFVAAGTVTIHNSIFWNNEGDRTPDLLVAEGGAAQISSSRLDGCPQYSLCDNLTDANPQFAVPAEPTSAPTTAGNFSLQPGSALVDAGDNSLVPAGVLTDRAGEVRIYNGVVDMGAFELPIACPAAEVSRLYVNGSVSGGSNSGLDWNNALDKLTYAFALADGCPENGISEVWVAAGKYVPSDGSYAAASAQDASFNLSNGLAVYGGFAGTELIIEERDWLENLTILSGDIEGDDLVDANGLVTDTMKIVGSNNYHVVSSVGNNETAVLDGFTINAGQADGDAAISDDSGGGILNQSSSPTLRHLTLLANTADDGGGMANISSSNPDMTNVLIEGNKATFFGGGIFNQSSSPILTNVAILDNRATSGAGMFNAISAPSLVNVTTAGNRAGGEQSSVNSEQSSGGAWRKDVLVSAAGNGGGMFNLNNSRPAITNSIFWQNEDSNGSGTPSATIGNDAGSIPLIGYSLVQGSGGSGSGWNGSMGFDQGHNIDADPLFMGASDQHLMPGSPAVDAGDNAANDSEHDLDVKPRISDGLNDGQAVIDLGAYEMDLVAITISSTPNTTTAKTEETITFTYIVTNSGKVHLDEIEAVDNMLGAVTLGTSSLDAGEQTSGSLSYTLQEDDIGTFVSTVTVSGQSAAGAMVTDEDTVAIEVRQGVFRNFIPILLKGW